MGRYKKKPSGRYSRTLRVRVQPTTYTRQGKVIRRKGYTYERKDVGRPGKGPELIPIRKGRLSKFGYSTKKSDVARHRALKKAVEEYGALSVYRMLQAQIILRKQTQERAREIFEEDAEWLREQFKVDGFVS
jgi:hypothetical protein